MNNKTVSIKVNVQIVNEPPAIGKPEMMGGIRSKDEAAHWALKNGYGTVYLWLSRQRVYADRLTKRVDVLAKQVQTKSDRLVQMAEV
jgi:hypothetical protein